MANTVLDSLVREYRCFLEGEAMVTPGTCQAYASIATAFLYAVAQNSDDRQSLLHCLCHTSDSERVDALKDTTATTISKVTIRWRITANNNFYGFLKTRGYLSDHTPISTVKVTRELGKLDSEGLHYISAAELELLVAGTFASSPKLLIQKRNAALICTAYDTGIKESPLYLLQWDTVHLRDGTIGPMASHPVVHHLTPRTVDCLAAYREAVNPLHTRTSHPVWLSQCGNHLSKSVFRQAFTDVGNLVGLPFLSPNDFRLTYAFNYLRDHPGDGNGLQHMLNIKPRRRQQYVEAYRRFVEAPKDH